MSSSTAYHPVSDCLTKVNAAREMLPGGLWSASHLYCSIFGLQRFNSVAARQSFPTQYRRSALAYLFGAGDSC